MPNPFFFLGVEESLLEALKQQISKNESLLDNIQDEVDAFKDDPEEDMIQEDPEEAEARNKFLEEERARRRREYFERRQNQSPNINMHAKRSPEAVLFIKILQFVPHLFFLSCK